MKIKLDENFGTRTRRLFEAAGHDVQTVSDEFLNGVEDRRLYEFCRAEQRCLITLDLDFSDVTRFPPQDTGGIVVIRVPRNPSRALLERLIGQFLGLITKTPVARHLWILEVGRVRIHQSDLDE